MPRPRHHETGARRLTILLNADNAALLETVQAEYLNRYGSQMTASRALSLALEIAHVHILKVSPEATTLGVIAAQLRRLRAEVQNARHGQSIRQALKHADSVMANLKGVQRKVDQRRQPGQPWPDEYVQAAKLETALNEFLAHAHSRLLAQVTGITCAACGFPTAGARCNNCGR